VTGQEQVNEEFLKIMGSNTLTTLTEYIAFVDKAFEESGLDADARAMLRMTMSVGAVSFVAEKMAKASGAKPDETTGA